MIDSLYHVVLISTFLYGLFLAFAMTTRNIKSAIIFKLIPLFIGIGALILELNRLGFVVNYGG